MLVVETRHLKAVVDAAEAAWPDEACGLLVGRRGPGPVWRVERIAPSSNLAAEPGRAFEVDPALRLRLERTLRGQGQGVVGHYHSHPGGPARPSETDLRRAYEPGLAWLIVAVREGQAVANGAFAPVPGGFQRLDLVTRD